MLENKKRDSQKQLSLEMGTEKGKGTLTALEVPSPVIFSPVIVAAIYVKGKRTLYQTEQLSPCFYSLSRQAFFR
jgi:hypothetical protein